MKKQSFLFIAGALFAFASCQNDTNDSAASQAQIDSAVNAQVEELRMQMMMQNDSIINAEAQRRADSMIAEMKATANTGGNRNTAKTTKPTQPKTTTPSATPVNNPKSDKLNEMSGGNQSDKKQVTPEDTKKKKGKLNEMSGN